jgi:hypothetical protein
VEGDGHRRVSLAHTLRLRTIVAEVFKLERRGSDEPEDETNYGVELAADDPEYEDEGNVAEDR